MFTILDFFKTRLGRMIVLAVVILASLHYVAQHRQRASVSATPPAAKLPKANVLADASAEKPTHIDRSSVFQPMLALLRPKDPPPPDTTPIIKTIASDSEQSAPEPELRPARVLVHAYAPPNTEPAVSAALPMADPSGNLNGTRSDNKFAVPHGTMIACALLHPVVATQHQTPLVAVVTADVFVSGEVLIPEGTVIHGSTGSIIDDRLHPQKVWRFTQNDRSEALTASVLHSEIDHSGSFQFGTAGFPGKRLDNPNRHTGRIFAATAIAAASRSLKQTSNGLFGNPPSYSPTNAGIEASAAVADRHADQLLEETRKKQPRLAVPAGATFYLYTTDSQ